MGKQVYIEIKGLHYSTPVRPSFIPAYILGYGKSHKAREMLGSQFYAKIAANKWWDKYNGEKNVLIEDMDLTHHYQGYYLKIWADRYAFPVEIKYGNDLIRPEVIIVTSNYSIKDIFPDPAMHEPLLRRFKEIHITKPWDEIVTLKRLPKRKIVKPALEKKAPKIAATPKKRKYDQPLKKPALYRQNADGQIIENNVKQPTLNETMEIAKEKEIIDCTEAEDIVNEWNYAGDNTAFNHMDEDDYEACYLCKYSYDECRCIDEDEDVDCFTIEDDEEYDEEESDDLFEC